MYGLCILRYIITNSYTYIEAFRGSFFAKLSRDISIYIGAVLCGGGLILNSNSKYLYCCRLFTDIPSVADRDPHGAAFKKAYRIRIHMDFFWILLI